MTQEEENKTTGGIEIFESPEALQEQLSKTEQVVKDNSKLIAGIGAAIVLLVGGVIFYQWNQENRNKEAQKELFPAQFYIEKDSASAVSKALKGDGNNSTVGLEAIAGDYSGTKAAQLANFYVGIARLKEGKFDEAISALESFSADDYLVQARAYSLIGDAYVEKKDFSNAINYYKKAVDHYPNEYFTPDYMLKLALAQELNKDNESAIATYRQLIEKFDKASEINLAKKMIAKLEATKK